MEKGQSQKTNTKDMSDEEYKRACREDDEDFTDELVKNLNKEATQ